MSDKLTQTLRVRGADSFPRGFEANTIIGVHLLFGGGYEFDAHVTYKDLHDYISKNGVLRSISDAYCSNESVRSVDYSSADAWSVYASTMVGAIVYLSKHVVAGLYTLGPRRTSTSSKTQTIRDVVLGISSFISDFLQDNSVPQKEATLEEHMQAISNIAEERNGDSERRINGHIIAISKLELE